MLSQIWIFMVIIMCASFQLNWSTVESSSGAEKILSLSGQPKVSFQQFGGYITVHDKQHRALYYYFVEAETNPASKPLILWLNGGPGCSSIGVGAFTEHGPFVTNYGESITKNKYSWNREANILYLESPAGVGFSYSTDKSFYDTLNDDITARDNLVFLQRWQAKFPQYKNNEFYIMGESYGGHYVPQLAELIVKSKMNFNLKRMGIGNPLLEYETDYNSVDEFYWSHGMISDYVYELRSSVCNNSKSSKQSLGGCFSLDCISVLIQISDEYSDLDSIDPYYVIGDKCLSYNLSRAAILTHRQRSGISQMLRSLHMQKYKNNYQYHQELDKCPEKNAEMYLNRKEVQKALHAWLVGVNQYRLCSPVVFDKYKREGEEIPTINILGSLIKSGLQVFVYRLVDGHKFMAINLPMLLLEGPPTAPQPLNPRDRLCCLIHFYVETAP
ncbi:Serine carboxypeptidase 45 [Spatholobus suberectus]|nr:Serine carboxypeptidase 45 [Spatholobus suberectus]